jgi:competence protein ComEA
VREAKNSEEVVRDRLNVVVGRPGAKAMAAPTEVDDFSDMTPLQWSDIVPSWPDDLDLQEVESPPAPASSAPAASYTAVGSPAVDSPAGPAVSSFASSQASVAVPAARYPWGPPPELDSGSLVMESMGMEPLAPHPAAPEPPIPRHAVPSGMPEWTFQDGADDSVLTGAGAFGSSRASAVKEHGGRLLAFDPGRRGVKALTAVAILVVLIAALLAWRARPRVDPVAVPPLDAPAALASDNGAGPPGMRASGGSELVVAVGGKVRKPGLVRLPAGARVADALQAAGGTKPGTDVAPLNLARKVVDGELIMVGVTPPPGAPAAPGGGAAPAAGAPINLNTATLADLDRLPGVGPVLAQRILAARDAQGGFKSVSDLRKVDGIGDSRYEQLKDLVTV